jgi:hypothetical protein
MPLGQGQNRRHNLDAAAVGITNLVAPARGRRGMPQKTMR